MTPSKLVRTDSRVQTLDAFVNLGDSNNLDDDYDEDRDNDNDNRSKKGTGKPKTKTVVVYEDNTEKRKRLIINYRNNSQFIGYRIMIF